MTDQRKWPSFTHDDGRVCHLYPYAVDGIDGLLHGYFTGDPLADPPTMRRCDREHGLETVEDERQ